MRHATGMISAAALLALGELVAPGTVSPLLRRRGAVDASSSYRRTVLTTPQQRRHIRCGRSRFDAAPRPLGYAINAHGIAVYGDDPHTPVRGLRLIDNEVDNLHIGASESVVVNGNVVGWQILRNTVRLRGRHLCQRRVAHHDSRHSRPQQRHWLEVAAENRHGHAGRGGVRTGRSRHNAFRRERLRGSNQLDDGSPEVSIQSRTSHDRFVHNAITAIDGDHAIYASVPRAGRAIGNISDHNTFAVVGGSAAEAGFGWNVRMFTGITRYRRVTGQHRHSIFR